MRYLLLLLLAALAALYFTVGIRIGMLNISDMYLFNVSGHSKYNYRTYAADQNIALTGVCDVKSGTVTLRFFDPQGNELGKGQQCAQRGQYALNLVGGGMTGVYKLQVDYAKFTGHLKITETPFGAK